MIQKLYDVKYHLKKYLLLSCYLKTPKGFHLLTIIIQTSGAFFLVLLPSILFSKTPLEINNQY